jgi:hypothetical protein
VAFNTNASNVSADSDSNGGVDIFIKDLQNPATDPLLVTRSTAGNTTANASSNDPQISADGSRILFRSPATDLDAIDAGTDFRVNSLYIYDVVTAVMKRITKAQGDPLNGSLNKTSLSADGRSVIFDTSRDMLGLEAGGVSYARHLYLIDLDVCFTPETLETELVDCIPTLISHQENLTGYSDAYNGEVGVSANMSADGQYVVYVSDGSNLDTSHGPSSIDPQIIAPELYLWDRVSNKSRIISQYMYNTLAAFEGSAPVDLGLSEFISSADFNHVYVTFGDGGSFADIPATASCSSESNCLYKLSLGIEQTDSDNDGLNDRQELAMGSNNNLSDTDSDGLSDGDEIYIYKTSPLLSDSDEDGIADNFEADFATSPNLADTDSDLLNDYDEINVYSTNPLNPDQDGDGLLDGEEVNTYSTDPLNGDTDTDGLLDGEEVNTYSTDPLNGDTDTDGLLDGEEVNTYFTDPLNADTDLDGMLDGWEVSLGLGGEASGNPLVFSEGAGITDSDNDGLTNFAEFDETNGSVTDPLNPDSDGDGISDYNEVVLDGTNPNDPTDFIAPSPP